MSARHAPALRSKITSSATSTSKGVTTACEYLADRGVIGKASTPARLTKRSNVDVQELAFFHFGEPWQTRSGKKATARSTIAVQGARVHNLKNISLELPRDKTDRRDRSVGLRQSRAWHSTPFTRRASGATWSRCRAMPSASLRRSRSRTWTSCSGCRRSSRSSRRPFVNNPRSTVGTMTDIASYLNLLFATIGEAHCPRTGEPAPSRQRSSDPSKQFCRCPRERRSNCGRQCSRSTVRSWISCSRKSARKAAGD